MSNIWKSISALAFLIALGVIASCTRDLNVAPTLKIVAVNTSTSTSTPTATGVFTSTVTSSPTVTNSQTSTSTPTITPTPVVPFTVTNTPSSTGTPTATNTPTPSGTPTNTPLATSTFTTTPTTTSTPQPPFIYEDFDDSRANSNGNCWEATSPDSSGSSAYMIDPYNNISVSGVTYTWDTTPPAPPGSGSELPSGNAEMVAVTFTSATYAQAGLGFSSEYCAVGCGGQITIPAAYTTTSSNLCYWVYFSSTGADNIYLIPVMLVPAVGGSGYTYYQDGTGTDQQILLTQGWQQICVPLLNTDWAPNLPANGTAWTVTYVELWLEYYGTANPYGCTIVVDNIDFTP